MDAEPFVLIPVGDTFAKVSPEDAKLVAGHRWYVFATYAKSRTTGEFMHRLILGDALAGGLYSDHIDSDRLNNTRGNLRACTPTENSRNRRLRSDARTAFKGVAARRSRRKPWYAYIKVNGQYVHLGGHATQEDAARAYDLAATQHFGAFARLNFPTVAA